MEKEIHKWMTFYTQGKTKSLPHLASSHTLPADVSTPQKGVTISE